MATTPVYAKRDIEAVHGSSVFWVDAFNLGRRAISL
jgi:hypothetical protein